MAGYTPPGMAGYTPPGMAGYTPPGMAGFTPPGMAGFTPPGMAGYMPPGLEGYTPPGMAGYTPPASLVHDASCFSCCCFMLPSSSMVGLSHTKLDRRVWGEYKACQETKHTSKETLG
jgi:hypothetical protein